MTEIWMALSFWSSLVMAGGALDELSLTWTSGSSFGPIVIPSRDGDIFTMKYTVDGRFENAGFSWMLRCLPATCPVPLRQRRLASLWENSIMTSLPRFQLAPSPLIMVTDERRGSNETTSSLSGWNHRAVLTWRETDQLE